MLVIKAYAASTTSAGRQLLGTSTRGITRAGRGNGQNIRAEREALRFMTPGQIRGSANRLRGFMNGTNR